MGQNDDSLTSDPYRKKAEWIRRNIDTKKGVVEIETIEDLKRKFDILINNGKNLDSQLEETNDHITKQTIKTQLAQKSIQINELKSKVIYWEKKGIKAQQTLNPNWIHVKGIANKNASEKVIDTQQQRNQQISNILQAFNSLEVKLTDSIVSFRHFFHPFTGFSGNVTSPYALRNTRELESIVAQEKVQPQLDYEDISIEEYNRLKNKGKLLEKTWYLECLVRYKRKLQNQIDEDQLLINDNDKESVTKCIKACDNLLNAFSEEIKWPLWPSNG